MKTGTEICWRTSKEGQVFDKKKKKVVEEDKTGQERKWPWPLNLAGVALLVSFVRADGAVVSDTK